METNVGWPCTQACYYLAARNNGKVKLSALTLPVKSVQRLRMARTVPCQGLEPDWYLKG